MRQRRFLTFALAAVLCAAGAAEARQGGSPARDRISLDDFKALLASGKPVVIIDVRGHIESKIKGARHVPLDQLESRLGEIARDREIVTYCA